ncbi:MFS transporter [Streptomyces sp. T1317-0309]|nr:MFS transporter [Streptomyces sp. T1317-0309]
MVGTHIDRHLRRLVVGSTVLFAFCVLVLALFSGVPLLVYIAVAAWGFAFGSSPSLFIGGAIDATGAAADVAQSITITVFSASIALGGFIVAFCWRIWTRVVTWASLALVIAAGRR